MNRSDFLWTGSLTALAAAAGSRLTAVPATPLRVAQIGTTHSHALGKWTTLNRLPAEFDVAGIWEPDLAERAKAQPRPEYAGTRWLEEQDLFADRSIQAVVVETELPDLLGTGRRCLEAGWHVHLDKPPGRDLAAFADLQQLAASRSRVLQHGYMYRYHPSLHFAVEQARTGLLGRILAVHGDIGSEMTFDRRPWIARAYGGSMLLLGCHLVDLAIAILGEPEAVTGRRRQSFPQRDRYFDNEVALLEYADALAVVRSLNFEVGGGARRQFAVFGESGSIEVRPLEPAKVRLTLKQAAGGYAAGAQDVKLPAPPGRYDAMMQDFAAMVRGGPSIIPYYTPAHDLAVHRTVLAAAAG